MRYFFAEKPNPYEPIGLEHKFISKKYWFVPPYIPVSIFLHWVGGVLKSFLRWLSQRGVNFPVDRGNEEIILELTFLVDSSLLHCHSRAQRPKIISTLCGQVGIHQNYFRANSVCSWKQRIEKKRIQIFSSGLRRPELGKNVFSCLKTFTINCSSTLSHEPLHTVMIPLYITFRNL